MDMTQLLEPLNAVGKLVQHKQRMGSANSRQSLQSTCEIPHHDDVFLEKGSRSPSQIAAISEDVTSTLAAYRAKRASHHRGEEVTTCPIIDHSPRRSYTSTRRA